MFQQISAWSTDEKLIACKNLLMYCGKPSGVIKIRLELEGHSFAIHFQTLCQELEIGESVLQEYFDSFLNKSVLSNAAECWRYYPDLQKRLRRLSELTADVMAQAENVESISYAEDLMTITGFADQVLRSDDVQLELRTLVGFMQQKKLLFSEMLLLNSYVLFFDSLLDGHFIDRTL